MPSMTTLTTLAPIFTQTHSMVKSAPMVFIIKFTARLA